MQGLAGSGGAVGLGWALCTSGLWGPWWLGSVPRNMESSERGWWGHGASRKEPHLAGARTPGDRAEGATVTSGGWAGQQTWAGAGRLSWARGWGVPSSLDFQSGGDCCLCVSEATEKAHVNKPPLTVLHPSLRSAVQVSRLFLEISIYAHPDALLL